MTLREAAAVAISGEKSFGDSIDEFLDTFYLDHPDKKRQQERIDDSPPIIRRRMRGSAPSASISLAVGALRSLHGQDGRNITSWTAPNSSRIREHSAPS
jgi:hypothetical protein